MNPRIDYLKSLSTLAAEIYPDIRGVKKLRYNARFCLWGILMPDTLARIQDLLNQPSFHPVRQHYPRTLEKPLKPYVCVKWSPQERAQRLIEHFAFLEKRHAQLLPLIYRHQGWSLFQHELFSIQLCHGPEREGSLALVLLSQDHQPLFTLAFNISGRNKPVIHIGALQGPGPNVENRQEIIRQLTHQLHGLRPKALIMEVLLILARYWSVEKVYGVTNEGHVYQALRYIGSKRSSVRFQYSELWQEMGGEAINPYWHSLPTHTPRKDPLSLSKTKRRLYTKRYAWLAELEQSIQANLQPWDNEIHH
ncbi:VirK/YbjX family protein [Vibrio cholerae]